MTNLRDMPYSLLQFYTTAPFVCSYLPNRVARSQVAAPNHLIDTETYGRLLRSGFRRSGLFTYRPCCDGCQKCIPVRIPVAEFVPNRSQRRALSQHANLIASECPLDLREEDYALYQRYQTTRHGTGGMDHDSREDYAQFLLQTHIDSRLIEFHEAGEDALLRMVCIIDVLPDGLSSVYTFYDPDLSKASFGTYAILWQIAQCQHVGLPYLYLGYWIDDSEKMSYKACFRPIEGLIDGEWQPLTG